MASGTPSSQVRIPVGDLPHLPPPAHLCSHYTTWGKNYPAAEKLSAGVKINRRRHAYPGRAKVVQKCEKKTKNCRTVPKIPYSISLYIEPNYILSLYIEPNYTLFLNIEPNYTLSLYIEPNYILSLYIEPNYTLSLYIEPNYTLS